MKCSRCDGLMVQDDSFDLFDSPVRTWTWRCVSCGDVVDPVILKYRHGRNAEFSMQEVAQALFPNASDRPIAAWEPRL